MTVTRYMPDEKKHDIKKVIILGSGALKIGEAGEFDYSGSQAIKAIKEESVEVILINPNIATIQTSQGMADKIYFLPVTPFFVEKVIAKEKPDGILLSFGGQTALNCGLELWKNGILKKYKVQILGTPIKAVHLTEDRELFNNELSKINVEVPKSIAVTNKKAALKAAKKIGYPVIVRAAFALGGQGSGVAMNERQLKHIADVAFSRSPQVLIEEYLKGWKEIEYEVVRDKFDNCVTVCNMENLDPMGIHTGESIVVAPSQTLTNEEYHKLREIAIKTVRHFGIVGECNIQYALDPNSDNYRVIEINARLSRSSALASKATGYPLAFIAAKLALGYSLNELSNSITMKTKACFEPALDYCVVKIPRWDLQKFRKVSEEIGSEMKSVGEVMAIGRKFEEALQKAIRMLNIGMYGLVCNKTQIKKLIHNIKNPTDKRLFAIVDSLKAGHRIEKLSGLSGIDKWFLYKIKNVVDTEKKLKNYKLKNVPKELFLEAKQLGFSDKQLSLILNHESELGIREKRKQLGILPVVKQIDTLAAEYPAETNYLYLTYNGTENDIEFDKHKQIVILGSGAYSIGSSVEFDWCCVNAVKSVKECGYNTIIINYNPETVSTDYDVCDKLYFDELSLEKVLDICDKENPEGVVVSTGGQIPNNLAMKLNEAKVKLLGTSAEKIDNAEDRHKFSKLCDSLDIDQPEWKEVASTSAALKFARKAGYPVLIRPSYVLSGSAMNAAFREKDLKAYLKKATAISSEYPVVVSKFILNAKEVEIDAVASKGELVAWAITEHVENAGVHSGDATMVLPPQKTYVQTTREIKEIARKLAKALDITGPFNIQFIAKDNQVKVIECNLRSSRSFPFISKVFGKNFIDIAIKAMLGKAIPRVGKSALELEHVGVKVAQFSFGRLRGADPITGVEMASTGEVGCLGKDFYDAFLKAVLSTGYTIPKKNILISVSGDKQRYKLINPLRKLQQRNYKFFATRDSAEFFNKYGIKCTAIYKLHEKKTPNVGKLISDRKLHLAVCVPDATDAVEFDDEYTIRRMSVDYNLPLITNIQVAKVFLNAIYSNSVDDLEIKAWDEYFQKK